MKQVYFLPICIGIGTSIGVAMHNLAMGVALGAAAGAAMSAIAISRPRKK